MLLNNSKLATGHGLTAKRPADASREAGAAILSVGGLAAAFRAAACCALPLGLGALGLGSAWLAGPASVMAPYRSLLMWSAVLAVGLGLVLAYRPRTAGGCASGACLSWIGRATKGGLWTAAALIGAAMAFG